ncbi:MAG: ATP-dependent Clp protease proteolytic subunit [Lachnospiraceae bacterium]|nr:ATP-dependent Clp protease proteolytic subunit [Lachnospiraceae bacterium]
MVNTSVPFKTANGTSWVPLESWLIPEGRIFIKGDITQDAASEFVQKLMYLKNEKPEKKIRIYIDSKGGEVNAGLIIYDAIKAIRAEADIICIGMAASMAAILLAGGQKGRRFILPHSKVMIHEPLIAGGVGGSASTIQRTAESILETKRVSVDLLASDTGRSSKEIEKAISFDNYMNAGEAIAFGICDEIITNFV